MALLALIKSKILLIGGAIIAGLLAVIKFQSFQSKRNKERAIQAEKTLKFRENVIESESEIDQKFSRRAEEAKQDAQEGKVPRNLRDPNDF